MDTPAALAERIDRRLAEARAEVECLAAAREALTGRAALSGPTTRRKPLKGSRGRGARG